MKNMLVVTTVTFAILFLITLLAFGYQTEDFNKFRKEAIQRGFAHYNGTTAAWEWIDKQ
jgi:preprotein translocase subunit SecG